MEILTVRLYPSKIAPFESELPQLLTNVEGEQTDRGYTIHHRMLSVVPYLEQGNRYYYTMWVSKANTEQPMGPMQFQPARPPLK